MQTRSFIILFILILGLTSVKTAKFQYYADELTGIYDLPRNEGEFVYSAYSLVDTFNDPKGGITITKWTKTPEICTGFIAKGSFNSTESNYFESAIPPTDTQRRRLFKAGYIGTTMYCNFNVDDILTTSKYPVAVYIWVQKNSTSPGTLTLNGKQADGTFSTTSLTGTTMTSKALLAERLFLTKTSTTNMVTATLGTSTVSVYMDSDTAHTLNFAVTFPSANLVFISYIQVNIVPTSPLPTNNYIMTKVAGCTKNSDCLAGHICRSTGDTCTGLLHPICEKYMPGSKGGEYPAENCSTYCSIITKNYTKTNSSCNPIEMVDLTQFTQIESPSFPQKMSNAYTMGMWLFIDDLSKLVNQLINFTLSNIMMISVGGTSTNVVAYCTPYIGYYPKLKNILTETAMDTKSSSLFYGLGKVTAIHATDRWHYVSCGFDLDALQMTVMIQNETWPKVTQTTIDLSLRKPIYFIRDSLNIVMDFFFRSYQQTNLSINLNNNIYDTTGQKGNVFLKLLSVFTDKLPISDKFPWYYFELSSIGSSNNIFKSLWIYGIDIATLNTAAVTMNITTYDNTFQQTIYTTEIAYTAHLNIPLNFYRMLLLPINYYFRYWLHIDLATLTCTTPNTVCWDDNSPLSCIPERFFDLSTNNCTTTPNAMCPSNTKPQISTRYDSKTTSGYCTSPCGAAKPGVQCPAQADYPSNTNNFACTASYTKVNMQCISNDKIQTGALFFSRYFGTPLEIKLLVSPQLTEYVIDFWFFFDNVFSPPTQNLDQPNYIWYTSEISIRKESSDHTKIDDFFIYYNAAKINTLAYTYNHAQWHRILYSVSNSTSASDQILTFYHAGVANTFTIPAEPGKLQSIFFCNGSSCGNLGSLIYWSSGFYRNIKIWNDPTMDANFYLEYDKFYKHFNAPFPRFSKLAIYYPLTVQYLKSFTISDPDVPENFAIVNSQPIDSPFSGYNYSVDLDILTEESYISSITIPADSEVYTATSSSCGPNCKYCNSVECQECLPGFLLNGGQCKSTTDLPYLKYYLKSPVFKNGSIIDLVYNSMLMQNSKAFSVSFYVKVLGSTDSKLPDSPNYDIMRFGTNLKLYYNVNDDKLQLINTPTVVFAEYPSFSSLRAKWINLSLAYYYDQDINHYFPAMMNFQVNFSNLLISLDYSIIGLNVDKITIPKESIAIYGKIWIWNKYINGPWSEMANEGHNFPPDIRLAEGTNQEGDNTDVANPEYCFDPKTVEPLSVPTISPCVVDVGDTATDTLDASKWCPSPDSTNCQVPDPNCPYGFYSINAGGTPSHLCGCTTNTAITNTHIWKNSRNNNCAIHEAQDFGQIISKTVENVASGPEEYTLGFWVYIQSYVSNQFLGFEIAWNTQLKVKLGYSNSFYTSQCFPVYEQGNDTYTDQSTVNLPKPNIWVSITCAVSRKYNVFYHLHHLLSTEQRPLTILTGPTVSNPTTLVFTNNSINRGIILIRHIALWKSYFCMSQNIFQIDLENVNYYPDLLHLWDLPSSGTIADIKGLNTMTISGAHASWIGYNILDETDYSTMTNLNVLCEVGELCHTLIKLNEFEEMSIPVDPSTNGRYTIEMWTAVDKVENLNMGYHVRWKNLASISVILSVDTSDTLNIYCWPQDFRLNLGSTYGKQKINDLTVSAVNYDVETTTSYANKTWKRVRCAVSYNQSSFYMNTQTIKKISPDFMGSYEPSDNPIRYFWQNEEKTQLLISGAKLNQSPIGIYIRNIYLFNDYLPQTHVFSHIDLFPITGSLYPYPSLIFSIDFKTYCFQLNRILIRYKHVGSAYSPPFPTDLSFDTELPLEELCPVGDRYTAPGCAAISLCGSSTTTEVCTDENIPLTCKPLYHWDPKPTPSCVQVCSTGLMRSPSSSTTSALCNMDCDQHYEKCPGTSDEEMNLHSTIQCKEGYVRYGYKCIDKTIAANNAYLYFNGCTNFPNGSYPFITDEKIENGHVISFWIKLDRFNEWCSSENKKKVYFLLEPHAIYLDTQSKTYAQNLEPLPEGFYNLVYENLQKSEIRATLLSFNPLNWNHIIIHYNKPVKFFKIYSNYHTHIPDLSIENLSVSTNLELKKLLFCSGNTPCSSYKSLESMIWGAAFYKNLKIFDGANSNAWLALETEMQTFTDEIHPLYFDFAFNVINAFDSVVPNLKQSDKIDFYKSYYNGDTDKDIIINYSSQFDYSQQFPGKYVSSYKNTITGEVNSSDCASNCKRCVSNLPTECVECNTGYKLFSGKCKAYNGYFVKTPIQKYPQQFISLNLNSQGFHIEKEYSMTWTIWIKFFGQLLTSNTNCAIIVRLKSDNKSYICYDQSTQSLDAYVEDIPLFRDSTVFSSFIGQWTLLSLTSMINKRPNIPELETYFPPIARFYVQNIEIPRYKDYTNTASGVAFDRFDLGNEISAFYSDLKIYRTFIVNPYGYIFPEKKATQLAYSVSLRSISAEKSCIANDNLNLEYYSDIVLETDKNYVSQLGISCMADYNPYISTTCDEYSWIDSKYFGISDTPCSSCSKLCKTGCAYNENDQSRNACVCSSYTADHWFKADKTTEKLSCEKVPEYDFSRGSTKAVGVKVASEGKYTMEFWFYIYSYNRTSILFDSFEVIWDLHNYIRIFNGGNNTLYAYCVPVYNDSDRNAFIGPEVNTTNSITTGLESFSKYGTTDTLNGAYFNWTFVQCSTNIPRNITYINKQVTKNIPNYNAAFPNLQALSQTQLLIQPGYKSKLNFGFLFIRELKLWSQWDIRKFTSTCQNSRIAVNIFSSTLLNYFKTETNEPRTAILDYTSSGATGTLFLSEYFVGYNRIEDVTTDSLLMPTMANCYTLSVYPLTGYNNLTHFTLSLQENIPPPSVVKCSYRPKETDDIREFGISVTKEVTSTFAVPAEAFEGKSSSILVEIYCTVNFEDYAGTTIYHVFSLNPEPSINQLLNDFTLDLMSSLSDDRLAQNVDILGSAILKIDVTVVTFDYSSSFQIGTIPQATYSEITVTLIPPQCTDYPNYCNGNGICIAQQQKLICQCYGDANGENCQFTEESTKILDTYISSFLSQISNRLNNTEEININLVNTTKTLLSVKINYCQSLADIAPFMNITEQLLNQTNIAEQLPTSFIDYMTIINLMFKASQAQVVSMKYSNLKACVIYNMTSSCVDYSKVEYTIVNVTQTENTTTLRQLPSSSANNNTNNTIPIVQVNDSSKPYLSLTTAQQSNYSSFFTQIENSVLTIARELIKSASSTDLEYYYNSTAINLNIKKISQGNFDFVAYFTSLNKTQDYKGYFDAKECIQQYFLSNANPIFMVYLYYALPSHLYDTVMLSSLISPNHLIVFLNSSGEEIALNCTKDIVHYLPLLPLQNLEFFNYYNTYPLKYNRTSPTLSQTVYPVYYIYPNGTIDHSAFSVQFEKYYNKYNLVLKRYTNTTVGYNETHSTHVNFTYINNQRYLVAYSNQLGLFGAFTELNTKIQYERYFDFVHYPQILNCSENYIYNLCFYIAVILLGLYLIALMLVFFLRNIRKTEDKVMDFMQEIKVEMSMIEKDNEREGDNRYSFYLPSPKREIEERKVLPKLSEDRVHFKEEQDPNIEIVVNGQVRSSVEVNHLEVPVSDGSDFRSNRNLKLPSCQETLPLEVASVKIERLSGKKRDNNNNNNVYNPLFFIFARNIYSNAIIMRSPFMPRYLYISKLLFLVFLQFALVTIMLVFVDFNFLDEIAYDSGKLGAYVVFAVFAANLPMILLCFLITTDSTIRRRLVTMSNDSEYTESEREEIMQKSSSINCHNIIKAGICNFMTFCSWVVIYYLSVGFCAFWKQWSHVMVILWLFTLVTDFLFMEVILELLIFLLYLGHNKYSALNHLHKFFLAIRQLRTYG